jgi:glycosyltransferase involved in cell wall biosynthesis
MSKILVIAPGRKTRGGITSVIREYEKASFWQEFDCVWIGTYIDRSWINKVFWFLEGYACFLWNLPGCSLVHIHLSERTSALRKSIFFITARLARKKIIIHFHAFSPENTIKGRHRKLYGFLFRKSDLVIVLSQYWERLITKEYGKGLNLAVLHNPVSSKNNNGTDQEPLTEPYILFAGTLTPRKGYMDLIDAFAKIAETMKPWTLVFAGNGELKKARERIHSLSLDGRVILKGWVSGTIKEQLFKYASIFCLPSYAEGFPIAVLEAWSYGLPVITTPVGGIPDIAVDRINSLLVEPGNVNQLSTSIMELMYNGSLRKELKRNSTDLIKQNFDLNIISGQIAEFYRNLIFKAKTKNSNDKS